MSRKIIIIYPVLLWLMCSCVSVQKGLTPEQRLYTAHAEYNLWMDKVTDTAESLLGSDAISAERKEQMISAVKELASMNEQMVLIMKAAYKTKQDIEMVIGLLKQRTLEVKTVFNSMDKKGGE